MPHPNNPRQGVLKIGKINLMSRLDGTCFPLKTELSLQGALVYWLDDLHPSDATYYKSLIEDAARMATELLEQRVAETSGIQLAGIIPPNVPAPVATKR